DNTTLSTMFEVSNAGVITVKDNTNIDYDTTTSYTLRATATNDFGDSNIVDIIINITDVVDTPPTIVTFTGAVDENVPISTVVGEISITDIGDSAITSFVITQNDSTTLSTTFEVSNSGTITVKAATIDFEALESYDLRAIATNTAGDSSEVIVTINVNDLTNENVPVIATLSTNVDEDAADGATIANVTITSVGDTAISSFTISGVGKDNFEILTDGTLKVKTGASLDFETSESYSLTMLATNDAGNSLAVDLTIAINNIAEVAPTLTTLTTSIIESASNGDVAGNIVIDTGDTAISAFVLKETDNTTLSTMFEVSNAGVITVKDNTNIDYDTTTSYTLRATATNDFGNSNTVNITINVSNTTDTVPTIENFSATIDENIAVGTIVGDINISNVGDSAISSFTMYESDGTTLNNTFIISNGGTISVKTGATIDYETDTSYDLRAIATNSAGDSNSSTVSITVTDLINEIVPTIVALNTSVVENTTNSTVIDNIEITTPLGDSNITSFTIGGVDASAFDINTSGAISVADVSKLDYETTQQFNLTVYATNDAGVSNTVALVVDVNNSAETAPVLTALTTVVSEVANNGDVVGSISINPGDTNVTNFDINNSSDGSESTIFGVGLDGEITVLDNSTIDYETTPTYNLTATATNDFGNSNTVNITINVNNVIDEKPIISNFTTSINENASINTIVGDINITNNGDSAISSFSLQEINGTISSVFGIANSGTISVIDADIDYEIRTSYDLRAIATNSAGDSNEANITININDLPDVVAIIESFTTSIDENISDNTLLGNITITDIGDSNITSFTINGAGATIFDINSSGSLKVLDNSNLDYETTTQYNLTIYATNSAGNSLSKDLNISIDDIPDVLPTIENFTGS
ncbi:MAG: cadherin domain-containing protein, partial [Campylobacterota bacterium]|nr:cadherin domain-containing protein [Campylobacterota bacterium]